MWMIYLAKEKDIGKGCRDCRFRINDKCIADERVDIYQKDGELNRYRPYCCPFRYFDSEMRQCVQRFDGMTEEETKGWFEGADNVHKKFIRLEKERDRYVEKSKPVETTSTTNAQCETAK